MPRYFFSVYDGRAEPDLTGTELPDLQAARVEAIKAAGRIISDEARRVVLGEHWRMEVADEHGVTLIRLDFRVIEGAHLHAGR